ncbi:Outer membrane protein OmpA [Balnearium lithotrophicum]|uniref:Outer membrane protein OmpA n=1 Tax=Balnearium lithotrophicum TaxID=223788 RepID=A0A521B7B7_9BACT|nr:OmpA family protein [Balnearium lithotrophicum]SMO42979.1 Outer membrane protein OmpA [Balnearium lithotrophicum]
MRKILTLVTVSSLLFGGCATTQQGGSQPSKTVTGAAVGAAIGAIAGAATGPKHHKGKRILIGAAAGALIGGAIGYILDQQANQLGNDLGIKPVDNTNPEVKPTEPPISEEKPVAVVKEPNRVKVVMKDTVLFDFNSYHLKPEAKDVLRKVAKTLNRDPDTVIVIVGYTDSVGDFNYNVKLSEKRAEAVRNELVLNGVDPTRIVTFGCGPKHPIAPNNTPEGRALNRRVEILVYPKGVTIPNPCD